MAKVSISPEAQRDLHGIKEYITTELDNPTAAVNTVAKITKLIRALSTFPDRGAPLSSKVTIPNDYRILVCGNYLVFYRHEGGLVTVSRVIYGKRDYMAVLFGDMPEAETETQE